ncbi:MAG TPA: hypothetical protein VEC11_08040 [Allosphingosinicella sp.]|nr:hypothetical protein [Allosphingosinicella sp.]
MRYWLALAMIAAAGSAPACAQETTAAAVPSTLAARVDGRTVNHAGEGVTVRVPAGATYVGGERFNLYGVADAEIHVYVEADAQRRLTRLYWIQFESYLPSAATARYNYADGNTRYDLWGAPTWLVWGPRRTDSPTRAGSDREHVTGILTRAGYSIPPEMMNVRMVQILDDPQGTGRGRRELMMIYSEDLAQTGRRYDELVQDGRIVTSAWQPLQQPLIDRATTAFAVERR